MGYEETEAASQKAREDFFSKVANGEIALDGVMSPLTRRLVEDFEAHGVDMTLAWACTPLEWECPSCGRAKWHIARLNSKGQLMCRLVEHHDHMKDLVERDFKLVCKSQNVLIADEQAKRFADRASQMVSAYDNAIICDDCNGADATAKGAAKAHKSFSYSPQEIRKFVRPRPNQSHEIDEKEAQRIWQENAETFELRLKIIRRIATIAATNMHWYQELPVDQRATVVYSRAEYLAQRYGPPGVLYALSGDKSRPIPEDLAQWRRVVQPKPSAYPNTKDIEYVAKVASAKAWNRVEDDWRCVACKRPKKETVRRSKKDWTFLLADRGFYAPTARFNSQRALVCAECGALATNLGKEASLAAGIESDQNYAQYLKLSELAQVVRPQAYGRHNVDNESVDRLMDHLVARVRALNGASLDENF